MTLCYSILFSIVSLTRVTLLPMAAVSVAVLPSDWSWIVALGLFTIYLLSITERFRRFARVGMPCAQSAAPHSVDELIYFLDTLSLEERARVQIVGMGWTSYLQRKRATGPIVYMHNLSGPAVHCEPSSADAQWYFAGTTIRSLQNAWIRSGKTLAFFPSYTGITIGSWFCGSHSGTTFGGGDDVVRNIRLLDLQSLRLQDVPVARFAQARKQRPTLIVAMEMKQVDNIDLHVQFRKLQSQTDYRWWLYEQSMLKVIFVGRGGASGVLWSRDGVEDDSRRLPRLCCGRYVRWIWHDAFASMFGWIPPAWLFDGKESLASANAYVPYHLIPIMPWFVVVANIINVELLIDGVSMTPTLLKSIVDGIVEFTKIYGGRIELRVNNRSSRLYIDLSFTEKIVKLFISSLKFKYSALALHPGKAQVELD